MEDEQTGVNGGQPHNRLVPEGPHDNLAPTARPVPEAVPVVQVGVEDAVRIGAVPTRPQALVMHLQGVNGHRSRDVLGQRRARPLVEQAAVRDIDDVVPAAVPKLGEIRGHGRREGTPLIRIRPGERAKRRRVQVAVGHRQNLIRAAVLLEREAVEHRGGRQRVGRGTLGAPALGRRAVVRQPQVRRPPELVGLDGDVIRDIVQPPFHPRLLVHQPFARHQPPAQSYFWSG